METCKFCLSENIRQNLRPDTMHYAEYRCIDCDRHLKWVPKPETEKPTLPEELFDAIAACTVELKRTGYTWQSDRVLDYCEKLCGKRSPHFLKLLHFSLLLSRLAQLPTATQHAPQTVQR